MPQYDIQVSQFDDIRSYIYIQCMEIIDRIVSVLDQAENLVRGLLQEAAAAGQYAEMAEGAEVGRQLHAIRSKLKGAVDLPAAATTLSSGSESRADPKPAANTEPRQSAAAGARRNIGRRKRSRSTAPPGGAGSAEASTDRSTSGRRYPLFWRDRDRLVKVGWSDRDNRCYEHRAPQCAVFRVAHAIDLSGANGRQFKMEEVLGELAALPDPVPSYQCYLTLAWLRFEGLVGRIGKEGYELTSGPCEDSLSQRWTNLPIHFD